jgi:hypothetical protein
MVETFKRRTWLVSLVAIHLCGALAFAQGNQTPSTGSSQPPAQSPPAGGASGPAQELANQISNPAAPLTYIQIRNILLPSVSGADGATNTLQLQPVLPIGREHDLPFVQLLKVSFPIWTTLPGPVNETGTGDMDIFDLVSVKASWGRWGFGPVIVLPTASSPALGAGKWQAGPAVAAIYTGIKNLTIGAVLQNPISFAGDDTRPHVNNLLISPTLTFNLKEGWFVGLTDYNFTFNWEDGGAATILLGIQVGKVLNIHRHPFSFSIEAGGAAARPDSIPNPGWIIGIEVTPIFKWHPGKAT